MDHDSYARRLVADVLATAEADSLSAPEAFTRRVLEELEQAGEVANTFTAHYSARGAEVSGYAADEDAGTLDLFVSYFRHAPGHLTRSHVVSHFRRLRGFLDGARSGLHHHLEESTDVHDMTAAVAKEAQSASSVRLFLLSNAVSVTSVPDPETHEGLELSHHVWDVTRLERMASSGTLSEPIAVDFDPPLPVLEAPADRDFSVYLAMLPGDTLADLYGQYGTRLLELNVRAFLQGRGQVNRGIRRTLLDEPQRFLAYNNGITATASQVDLTSEHDGVAGISRIHDLQIVNGGQTTASLHYAHVRDRAEVARVRVQMKLTVVPPHRREEVVPEISRYSNTQNKVTVVDFSSNHPFHVAVEKISRALWAPALAGGQETRWFYERARGQYADALARERTPANQRRFRLLHPPSQKFTKSDAAKYLNSWRGLPHLVSRGAEKNFQAFMTAMGDDVPDVDATAYRRLVATAILFRATDRVVAAQHFGGYKINTVTYTVAKLAETTGRRVDLDRIWREQALTDALTVAVRDLCPRVYGVITRPLRGSNVGEWAKNVECWNRVSDIAWQPPDELVEELADRALDAAAATADDSSTASVARVPAHVWSAVATWATESANLQPWQRQLAARTSRTLLAETPLDPRQATQALALLHEATQLGFWHHDLPDDHAEDDRFADDPDAAGAEDTT